MEYKLEMLKQEERNNHKCCICGGATKYKIGVLYACNLCALVHRDFIEKLNSGEEAEEKQ